MSTFGKWLVEKREARNLTQDELAQKAGCARTYITLLERDTPTEGRKTITRPSIAKVDAIAEALGVPIADARQAAGYAPPEQETLPEESELLGYFRDLPETKRRDIMGIVRVLYQGWRENGLRDVEQSDDAQ